MRYTLARVNSREYIRTSLDFAYRSRSATVGLVSKVWSFQACRRRYARLCLSCVNGVFLAANTYESVRTYVRETRPDDVGTGRAKWLSVRDRSSVVPSRYTWPTIVAKHRAPICISLPTCSPLYPHSIPKCSIASYIYICIYRSLIFFP